MAVVVSSVHGIISSLVSLPMLGLLAVLVAIYFGHQIWKETFSFARFLGWFAGVIVIGLF